ncbi:TonB-dependent receptor [Aquisediminimonas profunda]|uniref:TonB-dependent receptor n=1 Tax=Aquisediminimonas profunda TaxID=1550733 RepID=UPI001C626692|nr:TonB-dependent receptor [Aquisediminimonas profunda]
MNSVLRGISLFTIGAFISTPVLAQEAPQSDQGLTDIIVTAQRRDENLQKAAIPVTAVNSAVLTAEVSSGEDLTKLVPSVTISGAGGGTNQTTIRGIGTLAGNGLAEQVVALNLDGVYLARPVAANGLYYDLERVEVLKGPQGTLYGRNATAGAINVISRKPIFKNEGYLDVQGGNYNLYQAQGALNLRLSDTAAIRISGQGIHRDGYFRDGYNDQKQYSGRASILVEPSTALSLQLTADYVHFGGMGATGTYINFVPPSDPYAGVVNPVVNAIRASVVIPGLTTPAGLAPIKADGFNATNLYGLTGVIKVDTGAGELTIIPAYRRSNLNYLHYNAGFPVATVEHSDQKSLEVRFSTPSDNRFKATVGGYYFDEKGDFKLDAYVFGVPDNITLFSPSTSRVDRYNTTSLAMFGQATFDLTDTVRMIGGLRYTNEKKSILGAAVIPFAPSPFGNVPVDGNLEFNRLNWKAGIEADIGPRSLVYANVGTGFKAGGFFMAPAPNNTYRPESLVAVTVGSKNRFMDNKLQINLETYYWKYKDKQTTHLVGNDLVTENAGAATLYGFELETSLRASRDDLLSSNILYNHTKYDDYTFLLSNLSAWNCPRVAVSGANDRINCSGNVLQQSPKLSINLNYEHSFRLASGARVVFAAAGTYRSGYWAGDEQLAGQRQDAYVKGDFSLTYNAPDDRFYLGAYVENLGNEAVKSGSFVTSILNQPIVGLYAPRTYGVRAGINF